MDKFKYRMYILGNVMNLKRIYLKCSNWIRFYLETHGSDVTYKMHCINKWIRSINYFLVEALNVLLFGAGDCRHILKTIARSYKYPKKKIHVR